MSHPSRHGAHRTPRIQPMTARPAQRFQSALGTTHDSDTRETGRARHDGPSEPFGRAGGGSPDDRPDTVAFHQPNARPPKVPPVPRDVPLTGGPPRRHDRAERGRALWVAGMTGTFVLGVAVGSSGGDAPVTVVAPPLQQYVTDPAELSQDSAFPRVPAGPARSEFPAGTYSVGDEIEPGRYETEGPTGSAPPCSWARLSSLDGDVDSMRASSHIQGPGRMRVRESDAGVEFDGSCTWTLVP
jgi:hypothetical protein